MYRVCLTMFWGVSLPATILAQATAPHVVSDAYRTEFELNALRIVAAADDMPANRYTFRPTPAQMSFADVVIHVLDGNDDIGAVVGDTTAPKRVPVTAAAPKDVLVARLKETFEFARKALIRLDDSRLADPMPDYGNRAQALFNTINHWSDHYSQMAIYLRLNGVLPPTARGKGSAAAPTRPDTANGCDPHATMPGHDHQPASPPSPGRAVGSNQVPTTNCRP